MRGTNNSGDFDPQGASAPLSFLGSSMLAGEGLVHSDYGEKPSRRTIPIVENKYFPLPKELYS